MQKQIYSIYQYNSLFPKSDFHGISPIYSIYRFLDWSFSAKLVMVKVTVLYVALVGTGAVADTYEEPRRRSQSRARDRRTDARAASKLRQGHGGRRAAGKLSPGDGIPLREFLGLQFESEDSSQFNELRIDPKNRDIMMAAAARCTHGSCDYNDQDLGPGLLGYIHYCLLKPVVCRDSYSYPNVDGCSPLLASSTSMAYCITPATQTQLRMIVPPAERPTAL